LNFQCYKGCIRESKASAKRLAEQKKIEAEQLAALMGLWRPKEGDKCDYKPKGEETFFVPGTI